MNRRQLVSMIVIAAVVLTVTAVIAVIAVDPWSSHRPSGVRAESTTTSTAGPKTTRSAAQLRSAFLDRYVEGGRVVRKDQGGDSVSEGQSYGMLIAFASGDKRTFQKIWRWTDGHLKTPDGLLAWQWTPSGGVSDAQSASDADVDAARALVLAGAKWHDPTYTNAGKSMAAAIIKHETVETQVGRILLPGPWADSSPRGPWVYNASYASPAAFRILAKATGSNAWDQLETGSRAVTTTILDGAALPSDWGQVREDGTAFPMSSASGTGGQVVYGWNAMRVPLRYAESCDAADRELAGKLAPALQRSKTLDAQLDLGGTPVTSDMSAIDYGARAAAELGAGQDLAAHRDLERSDKTAATTPTYYGDAWAALAATMLTSNLLGGCAVTHGGTS
jgi:endoglucanase